MKTIFIILIVMFSIIFLILIALLILFIFIFKGRKPVTEADIKYYIATHELGKYEEEIVSGIKRFQAMEKEEIYITSFDNKKLKGYFVKNEKETNITIILVHGYHSAPFFDFSIGYQEYYKMGFDLLFVEQRAHEHSEGRFTTFGIKERFDVRDWTHYAQNRFPNNEIILAGVSMGSASVLFSLNLDLAKNVKACICDCGFSDATIEIAWRLNHNPKKIHYFVVSLLNIYMKLFEDITLKDTNAFIALKDNKLPILLAHSKTDKVVPYFMSEDIYKAITTYKDFIRVENARHAQSFLRDRQNYLTKLNNFLDKVL